MVCWIRRINRIPLNKRQRIQLPTDINFEQDLMDELGTDTHVELKEKLDQMTDDEVIALIERVKRRRRKKKRDDPEDPSQEKPMEAIM